MATFDDEHCPKRGTGLLHATMGLLCIHCGQLVLRRKKPQMARPIDKDKLAEARLAFAKWRYDNGEMDEWNVPGPPVPLKDRIKLTKLMERWRAVLPDDDPEDAA